MQSLTIELGQEIPLNADTFPTAITTNPYDDRTREFQVCTGSLEGNLARVTLSLLPIDHALLEFPFRSLKGNLDPKEVKAMIDGQRAGQTNDFVFPVINLADIRGFYGRGSNSISCRLEEDGRPLLEAAFTYKRCPLGLISYDDKLLATFWRTNRLASLADLLQWVGMKRQLPRDSQFKPPFLPGRLVMLSQADLDSNRLALRFSR